MADQTQAQRQRIQQCIKAGRYDDARALLRQMNHPQAAEWLRKLDALERSAAAQAAPAGEVRQWSPRPAPPDLSEPDFVEALPDFVEADDLPDGPPPPRAAAPILPRRLVAPRPSQLLLSWYRLPRNWLRLGKGWAAVLSALLLVGPFVAAAVMFARRDQPPFADFAYTTGAIITLGGMGLLMPYYMAWLQTGGYRAYATQGERAMRRYPYLWPVHLVVIGLAGVGSTLAITAALDELAQPIALTGDFYTAQYPAEWTPLPIQDSPLNVCRTTNTCTRVLRTFDEATDGLVYITMREYEVVPGSTAEDIADTELSIQRSYVGFQLVNRLVGEVGGLPAALTSYYYSTADGGRGFEHVYYMVAFNRALVVSFVMNHENELPFYQPEIDRFLSSIQFQPPTHTGNP